MKIGLVLPNPPKYSETFFTSKIKGLQAHGIEVVLFTQHYKTPLKGRKGSANNLCQIYQAPKVYHNYPILQSLLIFGVLITLLPNLKTIFRFIHLERNEKTTWKAIIKKIYLYSHILKHKVTYLHFGFATQALGSELVAKAMDASMAVSFRGFDINVYPVKHPDCYKKVWKYVDKVHSISFYLLEKAYTLGLSKKTPFSVITPAVDLSNFKNLTSQTSKPTLQILTIARLNWIKGIDTSITAMKILKEKGIDFKYHIIGDGVNKDSERFKFHVYELGLSENIIFYGKLTHSATLQVLIKTDLYIQPSYNEGFCNAVLEAQAMGKLCIASNVGGLPENIKDKKTGWLVPTYNSQALADKILEVIHLPEDKKQEISANAKERVKKYFTIEQQQQKFVDFYEKNS